MADPIVFTGEVEWSGENPGISLKEHPDGPFVTLASFFRVVLSPHGRGHALVLLHSPGESNPPADRANICLHDNEPLARYLVSGFLSHFGAYKGVAGLGNLVYRRLDKVETSGDPASTYSEIVKTADLEVRLTWSGLGRPFCFALPPDKSATGKHYMPSLFVGCSDATVTVNGRRLPGKPVPREMAGHTITTAMLAFSETWVRA
ncbi:MAG: hypothetical protein KJZ80_03785 [Hyphomicrobiaceae bacterium]|nr:hypothetical protein [Hyphomicrobiaceae bacterium]